MNKLSSIKEKFGAHHKSIWIFKGDNQENITAPSHIKSTFEYGMGNKFDHIVQSLLNTCIFGVRD